MITENTQNPVNVAVKAPRSTKKAWEFPISKAYYEKVRVRGEKIMDELGYGAEWMKYLMPHIDRYLLKGERLGNHYAYECMLIVFTCLRFDLDLAIERSAKAKARAAERRALKEAQKAGKARKAEGAQMTEEVQKAEDARKNERKRKIEEDIVVELRVQSDEVRKQEDAIQTETVAMRGSADSNADLTQKQGAEQSDETQKQEDAIQTETIAMRGSADSNADSTQKQGAESARSTVEYSSTEKCNPEKCQSAKYDPAKCHPAKSTQHISTTTREGDGEFEAAVREVADGDGTAVEEDGIFHNREAKSCSSGHSRTSLVDTVEAFEEMRQVF